MNTAAVRANRRKLLILAAIVLLCAAGYMLVEVNFSNPKLLAYTVPPFHFSLIVPDPMENTTPSVTLLPAPA